MDANLTKIKRTYVVSWVGMYRKDLVGCEHKGITQRRFTDNTSNWFQIKQPMLTPFTTDNVLYNFVCCLKTIISQSIV